MQHLEPQQLEPQAEPASRSRRAWLWGAAFVAVAAAAGWGGSKLFAVPDADVVTRAEYSQRAALLTEMPTLVPKSVAAADTDNAIKEMRLDAAKEAQVRQLVGAVATLAGTTRPVAASSKASVDSQIRLAEIMVWDTHASDGDAIAVASSGYLREVVLTKQPQLVVVPIVPGGSVTITGIRDGGGGITLGVGGPQQELLLPILSEGQALMVPISR